MLTRSEGAAVNDRVKTARGTKSAATATTLLQSACDRLPVGFALFDAEFRLAASNPRFAALRGYPRKLVKAGTPLESFVRMDAGRGEYGTGPVDAVTRTRLAALKRGRPAEREHALPDGRCVRIACERLPEGGLLLSCEDVTDARRTAQRLRESEERYDSAMRAINEGVYDWDIANGTIYYSDRVRAILRVSPKELRSPAAFLDRVHPDDRPRFRAATVAHFKGETERFECDYRFRARDGSWRWARQHGVALRDARGRAYRMVGSTGDITELKEREEQLAEQIAERTAIGELLEAISRSAFDLDAVLRTLIESATRLCRAEKGFIFRLDGDVYRLAVDYGGVTPEFREFEARHPMRPGRESLVGRTALTKQVVHLEDVLADREYRLPEAQRIGRLPHDARRADHARRRRDRRDGAVEGARRAVYARADPARHDLLEPGVDRDRERAAVRRDEGGARAADGDGGDPARDQRVPGDLEPVFGRSWNVRPACAMRSSGSCSGGTASVITSSPRGVGTRMRSPGGRKHSPRRRVRGRAPGSAGCSSRSARSTSRTSWRRPLIAQATPCGFRPRTFSRRALSSPFRCSRTTRSSAQS